MKLQNLSQLYHIQRILRFVDGFLGHEKSTNRVRQGFLKKKCEFNFIEMIKNIDFDYKIHYIKIFILNTVSHQKIHKSEDILYLEFKREV